MGTNNTKNHMTEYVKQMEAVVAKLQTEIAKANKSIASGTVTQKEIDQLYANVITQIKGVK